MKRAVDAAIIALQAAAASELQDDLPAFDLNLKWKTFPRAAPRITGYDVVAQVRRPGSSRRPNMLCLPFSPTPLPLRPIPAFRTAVFGFTSLA